MGALHFDADIDVTKLLQKVTQIDANIQRIAQNAANSGGVLDNSFKKAGASAAGLTSDLGGLQSMMLSLASVATLGRLGQQVINIRGEFQQLGIAFEVMLGSKEKADKLMQEQIAFAAKTPFTLTDVATNTKQLLAMGIATEKVMATMKALGDVAAGTSVPIARVAINYGQVATIGKLQGRELRDFAMAGIPLMDELAKNLGKAKSEIEEMVSAGQIGFPEVERAFQTMAGEGGKFYNLMERQNSSVTGQISNLTDKLQVMFNEIGKSNEGLIYGGISGLASMVTHYDGILKTLGVLVTTYGTYRAALMLSTAAQTLNTTAGVYDIATKNLAIGATLRAAAAQSSLNAVIMANPYVAAAAGIAALISIIYVLSEKAKTAEDYIAELNDSMSQIGKQIEIEDTVAKFEELNKIEEKTTTQQDELNKTVQKLALIFPSAVTETDKYGKAVGLTADKLNELNKEIRDNLILVSEKKSLDSQASLNKLLEEQKNLQNDINTGQRTITVKNPRAGRDQVITTLFTPEEIAQKKADLATLAQSIIQFGNTIDQENQSILKLNTIEANKSLEAYRQYFNEVGTYSKQAAIDAKSELSKVTTPEGSIASDLVKNQIAALDEYIKKFTTTGQQEADLYKQLNAAQEELNKRKKAGYESTDPQKDIADQEAIVKALKDKLGIKDREKKVVDELKQAEEDLQKAVISGSQTAISAAAARVTALENEKRKLQEIADLAKSQAWRNQFDGQVYDQAKTIGPKPIVQIGTKKTVAGILYEVTAIDKTGPVWTKVKAEFSDLKKFEKEKNKKGAKDQEELDKETYDKKRNFQEDLLNYSRQFTNELISQLGLTEKEAKQLEGIADFAANLVSGNYLGAAFSMGSLLISSLQKVSLGQLIDEITKKVNGLISSLNSASESANQLGVRDKATELGLLQNQLLSLGKVTNDLNNTTKTYQQTVDYINSGIAKGGEFMRSKTNQELYKAIQDIQNGFGTSIEAIDKTISDLYTKLLNPLLTDAERANIQKIIDSYSAIRDQIDQMTQEIIGTSVQDLVSSLSDAIIDGADAWDIWEQKAKDVIKKVASDQLSAQLLSKPITDAVNLLVKDSTNGLTADESKKFTDSIKSIYENVGPAYDAAMQSLKAVGIDLANSAQKDMNSATGSVQGITEDTASLISGQIMAIRVDIKANQNIMTNQLELMDQGLSVLQNIDRNTKGISRLETIENGIAETNRILNSKL